MKQEYLSLLACPKCMGDLRIKILEKNSKEVVRAMLTCVKCVNVYSMENGIPNMFYAPERTLQFGVREMFNETPYGLVGARQAMENNHSISMKVLHRSPWYIRENDVKGKLSLEAGCGGGHLYAELSLLGADIIGIDQTPNSLYQIKKLFEEYGMVPNLVIGNLEFLPFKNKVFDMITSMGVIHHTPRTQSCLNHFSRALKENGRIHVMVYHKTSAWNYVKNTLRFCCRHSRLFSNLIFFLTRFWMGETKTQSNQLTVFRDNMVNPITKSYNARELKRMCRKAGLKVGYLSRFELPELYVLGKAIYQSPLLRWYERRFGWFLHANMTKANGSN